MCSSPSFITSFELPNSKPHYNPDKLFSVQHLALDITLDPEQETVKGFSKLELKANQKDLSQILIDAVDMDIVEVKSGTKVLEYTHDGSQLCIQLALPTKLSQSIKINIQYQLTRPRFGLWFVKPDQNYPDKPYQIWTQGEQEGSRFWFPCIDSPQQIHTFEGKFSVPKSMTVISNGELVATKVLGDQVSFSWSQKKPIPTYLIVLAAGDFAEVKDKYGKLDVRYYASKDKLEELQFSGKKTPEMLKVLEKWFGTKYPWDKYYQIWVEDFIWGGMENVSATVNSSRALADAKGASDFVMTELLVTHELAHQWFGDLIVIDYWSHLWIKEGMATYCEYLWLEASEGRERADLQNFQELQVYLNEGYRRPVVTNYYRISEDMADMHSYAKAGLIYHMIRHQLGDEVFTKVIQTLLGEYAHQNVDSHALIRTIDQVSGKNIRPLLDQYLFRAGHPKFEVNYSWDTDTKLATLTIKQTQVDSTNSDQTLFRLTVPLRLGYFKNKSKKEVHWQDVNLKLDQQTQNFYFQLESQPDIVLFDVGNNYLKEVEYKYPLPILENILLSGTDFISKVYACKAIAKLATIKSLQTLSNIYKKTESGLVRAEIIKAMGEINLSQTYSEFKRATKDTDQKVRQAGISGLGTYKTMESYQYLYKLVQKGDEQSYLAEGMSYISLATVANSLGKETSQEALELLQMVVETKQSWNNILARYALLGISKLSCIKQSLDVVLDYTKLGIEQSLRKDALRTLGNILKYESIDNVEKGLDVLADAIRTVDKDIIEEMAIIQSLSVVPHPRTLTLLNQIKNQSQYPRTQRQAMEASEKISKQLEPRTLLEELRKDIDKLKDQNRDLTTKVGKLEETK
jgi:aminopeptidase N